MGIKVKNDIKDKKVIQTGLCGNFTREEWHRFLVTVGVKIFLKEN